MGITGKVGIGTDSPRGKLEVNAPETGVDGDGNLESIGLVLTSDADIVAPMGQDLELGFKDFSTGTYTHAMEITSEPRIGIGTKTPAEKLHVNGNVRVESGGGDALLIGAYWKPSLTIGGETYTGKAGLRIAGTYADISFLTRDTNTNDIGLAIDGGLAVFRGTYFGGKVGIGTTTPTAKLDIEKIDTEKPTYYGKLSLFPEKNATTGKLLGEITFDGASDGIFVFTNTGIKEGGTAFSWYDTSANKNYRYLWIGNNGKIGIGTSAPLTKLHVVHDRTKGAVYPFLAEDSVYGTVTSIFGYLPGIGFNYIHDGTPRVYKANAYASEINMHPSDGKMHFKFWDKQNTNGAPTTLLAETMTLTPEGRVGIGITSPSGRLNISELDAGLNSAGDGASIVIGDVAGTHMELDSNEIHAMNGNNGSILYLNLEGGNIILGGSSGGNVGIGTEAPRQKLDVNGWIRTTYGLVMGDNANPDFSFIYRYGDYNYGYNLAFVPGAEAIYSSGEAAGALQNIRANGGSETLFLASDSNIEFWTDLQDPEATDLKMIITNEGKVGIGTENPEMGFHLNGSGFNGVAYFTRDGKTFMINPNNTGVNVSALVGPINPGMDLEFRAGTLDSNNFNQLYLKSSNSNVGIGTNNPSEKLHVIGNVKANAYLNNSDIRQKKDIKTVEGLSIVEKLRGVRFRWKESGEASLGLIAQEVEEVLPEVVRTDNEGYKAVNYGALVAPLIEAVKELSEENKTLKKENKALQAAFCEVFPEKAICKK